MIFERAARREFAQAAAGICVALIAILASILLIRVLKEAASGQIAPESVLSLLGFAMLNQMPLILGLMLFVSVLLTLSRAYRDSEMVVWTSCGLPLTAWIRPVLKFALPIVLTIALLSGFLSPWASLSNVEYRQAMSARSEASQVTPGMFQEARNGRRVLFVETAGQSDQAAESLSNVFVAMFDSGRLGVIMADRGYQVERTDGDKFVVLERGRRYEIHAGERDLKVTAFGRYWVKTEDGEVRAADRTPSRMALHELVQEDSLPARGELVWRIGVPVSALLLALLAIPLSYVNPRAGRSSSILMAILIYAIYSNLLWVSQAWVSQGKVPFWFGVWMVHGMMAVPLLYLFYRRIALTLPWQRRR